MSREVVLLVDDESEVRDQFSVFLSRKGFRVVEAHDALAAVRAFRAERPDVVLTDYKMPEMTGLELLQELKSIDRSVPVILMSGAADMRTAVEAIRGEAFDFLRKPIDSADLLSTIRNAIDRSRETPDKEPEPLLTLVGPLVIGKHPDFDDITMIEVSGALDERARPRLEGAFRKVLEEHSLDQRVILTMRAVSYINNVGLSFLVDLDANFKRRGYRTACTQLSEKVYDYLNLLGYLDVFGYSVDLDNACARVRRIAPK